MRDFIASYEGLLLDTGLLLLLTVGFDSPEKISKFKRTQNFSTQDYDALLLITDASKKLITTPNVLTEASNILFPDFYPALAILTAKFEECYLPSLEVMQYDVKSYHKFGLTDTVLKKLAKDNILILTIDAPFYHYASSLGLPVELFNHIIAYYQIL